jgi:ABC-2 type transport system permease protein
MNPRLFAIRTGAGRGWAEFGLGLSNAQDVSFYILTSGVLGGVLFAMRDETVKGTSLSYATLAMPGVLGMLVAYVALIGTAYVLATEREDGTLLRAKAVPNGVVGYIAGHVVRVCLETVLTLLLIFVPALFFLDGLAAVGAGWVTVLWVLGLGLLACLPFGMVVGSLMRSPRAVGGWGMIIFSVLIGVSGIFRPVTSLPDWVQGIAQAFPVYWLGLGMRSAFLPDAAAAVEIARSWRPLETAAVLAAWAVAGLLLAPVLLRRMARRESGSTVAASREKALQRIG